MDTQDSTTPLKRCKKCGREFPATRDYFYKAKDNKDGLKGACVTCSRASHHAWYEANREYRAAYNKEYRTANRDYFASYMKAWGELNRDHKAATYKTWCRTNPQKSRMRGQRYRANKRGMPQCFTSVDWQFALDHFNGCCAVCGKPTGLWHTIAADHWIPLTASNCPGTVPWNIVPLCHDKKGGMGGCNNSKSNKPPADWLITRFGKKKGMAILHKIESFLEGQKPNVD